MWQLENRHSSRQKVFGGATMEDPLNRSVDHVEECDQLHPHVRSRSRQLQIYHLQKARNVYIFLRSHTLNLVGSLARLQKLHAL